MSSIVDKILEEYQTNGRKKIRRRHEIIEPRESDLERLIREALALNLRPVMMSIPQAAHKLGLGTKRLRQMIADGHVKAYRVPGGGQPRVISGDVLRAILRHNNII